MSSNLAQRWKTTASLLSKAHIEDADLEAKLILCYVCGLSPTQFILQQNRPLSPLEKTKVNTITKHRLSGKPLGYCLGEWEFMGATYKVGPGALIPRPETELLVLEAIDTITQNKWADGDFIAIELGVGSGIISIELAKRFPKTAFIGFEKSKRAFTIASQNRERARVNNLALHHGDFFQLSPIWEPYLKGKKPVIFLSNPPYIPASDIHHLDKNVKDFEPKMALDGGKDGLDFYKKIVNALQPYRNTAFVLEIGIHQEQPLTQLLQKIGPKTYSFKPDLNGVPRVLVGCI
jgi:release factor glutamine methyltransferase